MDVGRLGDCSTGGGGHLARCLWLLAGVAWSILAQAEHLPPVDRGAAAALDRRVESLKQEVLELNRDLSLLERELLFPDDSQFAVFLTQSEGRDFTVTTAQFRLGDQLAASHIYAEHEMAALQRGGAHRLHLGNLTPGKHRLTAVVAGRLASRREFRRTAAVELTKGAKPVHVELRLEQRRSGAEPELLIREW